MPGSNAKTSLLIIDDESSTREALGLLFENKFRVEAVGTADAAIEALRHSRFAVALVDIGLPGMNGLELLKVIQKQWPYTQAIMVTADKNIEMALNCYENGAYDFVVKPWNVFALKRLVQHAAEKHFLRREKEALMLQWRRAAGQEAEPSSGQRQDLWKLLDQIVEAYFESSPDHRSLPDLTRELEKRMILRGMSETKWNQLHTALLLGVTRNTVAKKLKQAKIPSVRRPWGLSGKNTTK